MKKLIRKPVHFKGLTVGLDLHKKFIEFAVLDQRGDQSAGGRIAWEQEELRKFINKWKQAGEVQVVVEACGCFVWVFDLLSELLGPAHIHVAQPGKIRVIANSQEKNDANDAWWLAYLLYEGRLPEAFVATGKLRELRIASREVRAYVEERSDLLRRFSAHLAQSGHKPPKEWHRSRVKREVVKKLLAALKNAYTPALLRLERQIRRLSKEIAFWCARVKQLCVSFPAVQTMIEEMPGLGPTTAATVYAELGDPQRFKSEKAYAKATGLTPGYRITGGKKMAGAITRAGSAQARWALTQAAMACKRCRREQHRKRKKVVVAAGRKLAEGIWRLFALGECFDLAKAFPGKACG
jgi:transposase